MRSEFRDVDRVLRDSFPTADIPLSMHVPAGGVESNFYALPAASNVGSMDSNAPEQQENDDNK